MDKPEREEVETEVEDDDLLGAIDEGIADAGPEEDDGAEPETDDSVPESEGGDEPPDGEEPEPSGEQPEPTEDKPETAEPDEPEPEKAEERPSDQFGELDKDTSEKTRQRFESLKRGYDDLVSEREALKEEMNGWRESIQGTGTNPQQFGMMLDYLKSVNSGNRDDLEKAYTMMQTEMAAIAKVLGKSAPGVYNVLDDYPDLKQRVNDGDLSEKDAHELAAARSSQRFDRDRQQEQQTEAQQQQAVQIALAEVRKLGERLEADPLFQQKRQFLEPIISSAVESGLPPQQWVPMIERAYKQIKLPQVAAPTKPNAPVPMRPSGPSPASTNMEKDPGSEMEAIDLALSRGW